MSERKAIGDGPVVFFDDEGRQISIPLSAITIDGGTVKVDQVEPAEPLETWLKFLVTQGRLTPDTAPAAPVALVATAAVSGANGNTISVNIAKNNANPTLIDVTVTETDMYEGLTIADKLSPSYLPTVIGVGGTPAVGGGAGTPGTSGARPGLVRVTPTAIDPPLGATPADPIAAKKETNAPNWTFASGPGAAPSSFSLEPRILDPASATTSWTVEVKDILPVAGAARSTFTLAVTWRKTVTLAPTDDSAALLTKLASLGLAVTIKAPDGAPAKLPALGTFTLRGGADVAAAKAATATLVAQQ